VRLWVWELSLKHHRGKLPELGRLHLTCRAAARPMLRGPSRSQRTHGLEGRGYPQPHRDPFESRPRLPSAKLGRLVLLSADPQLSTFPCQDPLVDVALAQIHRPLDETILPECLRVCKFAPT